MGALSSFREIWSLDFEFVQADGGLPVPVCLVAKELKSNRLVRLWQDQLQQPPFSLGPDSLFVAYFSSAEWSCFLSLGWPLPVRILDLYAEFRCLTSGLPRPCGSSLLGAMAYFGLDALDAAEKDAMRNLIMAGGPWSDQQRSDILSYCQTDVDAVAQLLPAMILRIDVPRALLRGRYMAAVARMETVGVPVDVATLEKMKLHWGNIQDDLIARIDRVFGVFDGRTFKADRWQHWCASHGIPWPRLATGALALDDDTFKDMSRSYPDVSPMRELRTSLSQLRLNDLTIGPDGRNRCLLSPFGSKTGRNQPSNSKFIFGPATWIRGLIRPTAGNALAYLDYEQQEFGIAAALSGDPRMMEAYRSGDPYLTFAKQAGAVPADATKATHGKERDKFKTCALGVQYGIGELGLARKLDDCPARARELLRLHRETYSRYWQWSDSIRDCGMLRGKLQAVFGWTVHTDANVNPRALRNFPLQANGAEMIRLACCMATERSIRVCCPVHDALLIEAPEDEIESIVGLTQGIMEEASRVVLSDFTIRTEAKIIRDSERFIDDRGRLMWNTVSELLETYP